MLSSVEKYKIKKEIQKNGDMITSHLDGYVEIRFMLNIRNKNNFYKRYNYINYIISNIYDRKVITTHYFKSYVYKPFSNSTYTLKEAISDISIQISGKW